MRQHNFQIVSISSIALESLLSFGVKGVNESVYQWSSLSTGMKGTIPELFRPAQLGHVYQTSTGFGCRYQARCTPWGRERIKQQFDIALQLTCLPVVPDMSLSLSHPELACD